MQKEGQDREEKGYFGNISDLEYDDPRDVL